LQEIRDTLYAKRREQAEREATPSLLLGCSFFVEGLFALIIYRSLRITHDQALSGTARAALGGVVCILSRHIGPQTKSH
jgi:hypothetical protein